MKRFDQVLLSACKPGDRFYFAGDAKKIVFEVVNFEYRKQAGFNIRYCNCMNTVVYSKFPEAHKANRRVIFLRNINDKN